MARSLVRLSSCLAVLLGLASACEGPPVTYGEGWVAIRPPRPPQAGASGGSDMAAGAAASTAGSVGFEPATGGTAEPPPDAIDAGAAGPIDPPRDAGGPLEPPSFCPVVPKELLDPGVAGDGSLSGCPPKVCESALVLEGADLSQYVPVTGLPATAAPYEGCTHVRGDVLINFAPHADLERLSCLERVDGSLFILNTADRTELTGLESLAYVTGDLRIARLDSAFADANSLTSLDALANLRAVGGTLALRTPYVRSLEGLRNLHAVGGGFVIDVPVELESLAGARSLRAIGGDLRIAGTYRFTSLHGLEQLDTIGGALELTGNADIPTFREALPKVTCIGGSITIEEPNPFHQELDLLPVLERVGGMVSIKGHPLLRSITMLDSVWHVRGSIQVQNNESLERLDLSSLQVLDGSLSVTHNPRLEECPLIDLADSLGAGALSEIHDNARAVSWDCRTALRTP